MSNTLVVPGKSAPIDVPESVRFDFSAADARKRVDADAAKAHVAKAAAQIDYTARVGGRTMVESANLVHNLTAVSNLVGDHDGAAYPTAAKLADALGISESYLSRLRVVGHASVVHKFTGERLAFVVNNPGGNTSKAVRGQDTKADTKAAREAVDALRTKAAKSVESGGEKGKGGTSKPRGGQTTAAEKSDDTTPAKVAPIRATFGDCKAAWDQIPVSRLSASDLTKFAEYVAKRVREEHKARETLAAKADDKA